MIPPLSSTRGGQRGVTMLEVLVALALSAVISASMLPQFSAVKSSYNRNDARQQLAFDLRRLMSRARKDGAQGAMTISADGRQYTLGLDHFPYSSPPNIDTVILTRTLPNAITVTSTAQVLFDSRGFLIDNQGSLTTLTLALQSSGNAYYSATLYPTGFLDVN